MRMINISNTGFEITDSKAEKLLQSGALYPCGEMHDLHLDPTHDFNVQEVEDLMKSSEE